MYNNTNPPAKTELPAKPEPPAKTEPPANTDSPGWFFKRIIKNNQYTDPETRYKSKKCRYY